MGIASLILGIISILIGIIPILGIFAFIPAIVGLVVGIIDLINRKNRGKKKAVTITGILTCSIAVVFIAIWAVIIGVASSSNQLKETLNNLENNSTVNTTTNTTVPKKSY